MKICIYHEHHPLQLQYGGEFTTLHLAKQAIREGHKVEWITSDGSKFVGDKFVSTRKSYLKKLRKADLYLIGTFNSYPDSLLKQLQGKKYAVMHHHSLDFPKHYLTINNDLSIFLAPDHEERLPSVTAKNSYITTAYIDHSKFYDKGEERKKECVYVGTISQMKIMGTMLHHITKNYNARYNFYGRDIHDGRSQTLSIIPNVKYHGEIKQSEVNNVLNKYEVFFWYLDRYGCYGRTIIEAALSGCRLEVNQEAFGIFKHDWDLTDRQSIVNKLEDDLQNFWSDVIKALI